MKLELTPEQVNFFDRDGYLVLRKWIPLEMILRLSRASNEAISQGLHIAQIGKVSRRVATVAEENKLFVTRINDLFVESDPVFLELLGCPGIVNVATALTGEDCISTYESLVVKNKGDDQNITWHRDMIHDRHSRIFTLGVYLDESLKGKGVLRFLPRSQSSAKDVCLIEDEWKRGERQSVEIEMYPGDILLHDVMLVHASEPILEQEYRRTVYFEFRSQIQARTNPGFPAEWIALRRYLIELAQQRCQKSYNRPFDNNSGKWSKEEKELIDKLSAVKIQNEPGHYCFR